MSRQLSHGKPMDVGEVGIDETQLPAWSAGFVEVRAWFPPEARARPLDLEIGVGKGAFMLQQAALETNVNFLGIEWAKAFWRYAADRCRRRELANVRLVRADAVAFVRSLAPDRTFRQIHVYFPDPWPKARHHRRRLIQAPMLREFHRVLEVPEEGTPKGLVRLATDHTEYFHWMGEHAAQVTDLFEILPFERPTSAGEGELVGTNFERKYKREGRPFHGMVLRKKMAR